MKYRNRKRLRAFKCRVGVHRLRVSHFISTRQAVVCVCRDCGSRNVKTMLAMMRAER